MGLLKDWCQKNDAKTERKRYLTFVEKSEGRDAVHPKLIETVRSHYDRLENIADDIESLGYEGAANVLRTILPKTKRARSGDLGEIIATEVVEQYLGYNIPVRRLRYKDGREMALRGDDFIGITRDKNNSLRLLKGEAKSRTILSSAVIAQARAALNKHSGRCTPDSLAFVVNRLLESSDKTEKELGREIRNRVGKKTINNVPVSHMLFTLSGNKPPAAQKADLDAASADRNHYSVNLTIDDHPTFIAETYEKVLNFGNG